MLSGCFEYTSEEEEPQVMRTHVLELANSMSKFKQITNTAPLVNYDDNLLFLASTCSSLWVIGPHLGGLTVIHKS